MSRASSPADWYLRSRSFDNALSTIVSTSSLICLRIVLGLAGSTRWMLSSTSRMFPITEYGNFPPVSIWYSITPSEYTSVRRSIASPEPVACSGDAHGSDPMNCPVIVIGLDGSMSDSTPAVTFASPKSTRTGSPA